MKKKTTTYLFGLVSGIVLTLIISKNKDKEKKLPHADIIQKYLAKHMDDIKAGILTGKIRAHFLGLFEERPIFENDALRNHLETFILPGIAIYQVLQDKLSDKEKALSWSFEIWEDIAKPSKEKMGKVGELPIVFDLFKKATPFLMKTSFPQSGWQSEILELGENTLGFDMKSCFYLEVLSAYEMPELTPAYCYMDEIIYGSFSPHVSFKRTQTLANGGDLCDFRFIKASEG